MSPFAIRLLVTLVMLASPFYGIYLAQKTLHNGAPTIAPLVAGFMVGISLGIPMGVKALERTQYLPVLIGAVIAGIGLFLLGRGYSWSWLLIGFGSWTALRAPFR